MKTLILARNPREAGSYAASMGIARQHFRAVQKAEGIRSVRNAEVHLLPGFLERRDRHGILQALRASRHLEIFYVDPADVRESSSGDIGESRRTPTERELEAAYRYNALRDVPAAEPAKPQSVPKPRAKRGPQAKPVVNVTPPPPAADATNYFA